jgi:hypothetical protein
MRETDGLTQFATDVLARMPAPRAPSRLPPVGVPTAPSTLDRSL